MKFYIQTLNDNGSGMKYNTKEECLKEIDPDSIDTFSACAAQQNRWNTFSSSTNG